MMKKNSILVLLCVLGLFMQAKAQFKFAIGVKGGGNVSKLIVENQSPTAKINFQAGFNAGIMTLLKIGKFGIQPEALFSRQGYSLTFDFGANAGGKATTSSIQDYVNIPLVVKFYPVGGFNIQFGPQFGLLLAAKVQKLDVSNSRIVVGAYEDNKNNFENFDFGLTMGLGWDFPFGLTIDARYNMGLVPVVKPLRGSSNSNNQKHQVIQLSVGYQLIRLGKD